MAERTTGSVWDRGFSGHLHVPPPYGEDWALFLDVDRVLLQLADHPAAVEVRPALRDILRRRLSGRRYPAADQ